MTLETDMATRTNKALLFLVKSITATAEEKTAARLELYERQCGRGYGKGN